MKKPITICVILMNLCFLSEAEGQDIHFSQFYQTPLMINPALTGLFNGDHRVSIHYKDQWRSVGTPYKTYALMYDMALFKRKWKNAFLGVGFNAFNDKAGNSELGITQFNLSLSSIVSLNDNHSVSAGLQGGFAQRSINFSNLSWENQSPLSPDYDPGYFDETNYVNAFTFGDFSAGVTWTYWKGAANMTSNDQFKINIGGALFHINRPKLEFYDTERLYTKLIIHGRTYIGLKNTNTAILPSILFLKQGPTKEINFGGMVRYRLKEESRYTGWIKETAVLLGGHYRVGDAFIASFTLEIANFALGISYDINVSGLTKASNGRGGIEISLRYINPNPFRYGKDKAMF